MMDLRCDNGILFGRLSEGVLEVKCRSARCGHETGVVVLHQFDLETGELKGTKLYRDPVTRKGEENGSHDHPSALRSA